MTVEAVELHPVVPVLYGGWKHGCEAPKLWLQTWEQTGGWQFGEYELRHFGDHVMRFIPATEEPIWAYVAIQPDAELRARHAREIAGMFRAAFRAYGGEWLACVVQHDDPHHLFAVGYGPKRRG